MMLNFHFEKRSGKTTVLYLKVSLSHSQSATAFCQEKKKSHREESISDPNPEIKRLGNEEGKCGIIEFWIPE